MTATAELNERLRQIQEAKATRAQDAVEAYQSLIYLACDGGEVDPAHAAEILADVGRSAEQFEADCRLLEKRKAWCRELDQQDKANHELAHLEAELDETRKEWHEEHRRYELAVQKLCQRRDGVLASIRAVPHIKGLLRQPENSWPWLRAELDDIRAEVAEKGRGIPELQSFISGLKDSIASLQMEVDAFEKNPRQHANAKHDHASRKAWIKTKKQQQADAEKRLHKLQAAQKPALDRLAEVEAKQFLP